MTPEHKPSCMRDRWICGLAAVGVAAAIVVVCWHLYSRDLTRVDQTAAKLADTVATTAETLEARRIHEQEIRDAAIKMLGKERDAQFQVLGDRINQALVQAAVNAGKLDMIGNAMGLKFPPAPPPLGMGPTLFDPTTGTP